MRKPSERELESARQQANLSLFISALMLGFLAMKFAPELMPAEQRFALQGLRLPELPALPEAPFRLEARAADLTHLQNQNQLASSGKTPRVE